MTNQRLQIIAFYVLLAAVALVVLLMWLPYLKLIALGAILAILFLPVYKRVLKNTGHEIFAAWATIILIMLIVIIPLLLLSQLVYNELSALLHQYKLEGWNTVKLVEHLPEQYQYFGNKFFADLGAKFSSFAGVAVDSVTGIVSSVAKLFISFFFVFFTAFYLLRDGDKFKTYMSGVFPLSEKHENIIIARLESAIAGVVKGSFLIALIQGAVGTIGYFIFGLPAALLWGGLTVLAALVPNIGTALAWIPAVLYLFISGHTGAGIGMLLWSVLLTGTIDNFVSPKILSHNTQIHPLLVLFGVLGGLELFGVIGVLLGPIMMAVFVTLLDIYRTDLKSYLDK